MTQHKPRAVAVARQASDMRLPAIAITLAFLLLVGFMAGCAPEEAVDAPDDAEAQDVEGPELADPVVTADEVVDVEPEADQDTSAEVKGDVTIVNAAELKEAVEAGHGRVTLVNFWATWCPPCVNEMPYFVEFYEKYPEDEVAFISVTADAVRTIDDTVKPFLANREIPFDVLVIEAQPDEVSEALQINFTGALPVTLIYDQDGELVQEWHEELVLADLEEVVNPLLATS